MNQLQWAACVRRAVCERAFTAAAAGSPPSTAAAVFVFSRGVIVIILVARSAKKATTVQSHGDVPGSRLWEFFELGEFLRKIVYPLHSEPEVAITRFFTQDGVKVRVKKNTNASKYPRV